MSPINPIVLEALVDIVELALQVAPHIADAIKSHGELTEAKKADLITRVKAARAAVAAYEPQAPIPDPKPTVPDR